MHSVQSVYPPSTSSGGICRVDYLHERMNLHEMLMTNVAGLSCRMVYLFLVLCFMCLFIIYHVPFFSFWLKKTDIISFNHSDLDRVLARVPVIFWDGTKPCGSTHAIVVKVGLKQFRPPGNPKRPIWRQCQLAAGPVFAQNAPRTYFARGKPNHN